MILIHSEFHEHKKASTDKMTSPVEWVKFFEGAEIPHVTALEYAVTFADQRISFDMLADLDKVNQVSSN